MSPSKSSLDRLPKQLSRRWEEHRAGFEEELRAQESVPVAATTAAFGYALARGRRASDPDAPRMGSEWPLRRSLVVALPDLSDRGISSG